VVIELGRGRWRFEAYCEQGRYRWRLRANTGEPVATSAEPLSSESNARRSAAHFKAIARSWMYEIYVECGRCYRWRAKATNGRAVAVSHACFDARRDAERAVNEVMANAGRAADA
jgi:uncharacterized protein YegP (UPF0339 family)